MKKKDSKVEAIIKKYEYDQSIQHHANKYFDNNTSVFSRINSNEDVERCSKSVRSNIEYFQKIFPLQADDIEAIEKELGKYELAVKRAMQCIYNPNCNFEYSAEELMNLIDNIKKFESDISTIQHRKICQD